MAVAEHLAGAKEAEAKVARVKVEAAMEAATGAVTAVAMAAAVRVEA